MRKLIPVLLLLICLNSFSQLEKPDVFIGQSEMSPSGGQAFAEFYSLESNLASLTKAGVSFPTTGNYRFDMSAYKVAGTPMISVSIDGVNKGMVSVTTTTIGVYSLYITNIIAGTHTVAVQLTNFSSAANYGRVGLLYFTLTSQTMPYVYPILSARDLPTFNTTYLTKEDFGGQRLRGFSLGSNGTNQPTEPRTSMIAMKATGANIARCFVEIERLSGDIYTFKSGELTKLDTTLARASSIGFYIVPVMFHNPSLNSDYWGTGASPIARRLSIANLWKTLAARCVGKRYVAALDLINEPRNNDNYAEVIRWQTQMIDTIRTIDPDHVIAVECIKNDMFAMMLPLGYTNIIYSPHGYSPINITHQGVVGESGANIRNDYPHLVATANLGVFVKVNLSAQHDDVRIMANRFHVPIFIGEFSCVNWAPASSTAGKWTSTEWTNDNISLIEAEGWSWVYHNWARGGEAIEWDPEIPSSFYSSGTFTNARPAVIATKSNESTVAPTIVMLEGWFALNAPAAPVTLHTWYLSSVSGDDNRTSVQAKNINTPWKTLGKMNSFFSLVQPGDSIVLKAGETFPGTLIITKSGTSSLPITIGSYGSGVKPIITGLYTVPSWTSMGGNKYRSDVIPNGLNYIDVVLKDGYQQGMGRWPNSDAANAGWLKFDGYNTAGTQITDDSLSAAINYVGSEMVFAPERWVIVRGAITAQSGTPPTKTLSFVNTTGYSPASRFSYFIQNSEWTLNKNNEWFYDTASFKKLIYYSTSGAPTGVQITTATDGITSTNFSDITINGIEVSGFQNAGIKLTGGTRNKVIGCTVKNCTMYNIYTTGTNNYIYNNTLTQALNTAISCGSTGTSSTSTIVRKNYIDSTSMFPGHCATATAFSMGYGINASGTGMIIDSNDIHHQGFIGINYYKWNDIKVLKNWVDYYAITKDDGGAIYTLRNSPTIINTGREISGNLITNGVGAPYNGSNPIGRFEGAYMDLAADGTKIKDNFFMGCSLGVLLNYGANKDTVRDNLIYLGTTGRAGIEANYRASAPTINNSVKNNIIWAKDATQELIHLNSDVATLPSISSDSNKFMNLNTYLTPFQIDTPTVRHISLATWRTLTGDDIHSTQTTFTTSDSIRVYINPSFTSLALDLTSQGSPYNWITPTGIVSAYTLAGRSAIILKRGTIVANVPPSATGVFTEVLCFGGTSTVTVTVNSGGTAPFTYSINNGASYQSSNLFTGQTAGSKSIIVKDANNLKDTADVTIIQPSILAASSTKSNPLCNGNTGTITVSAGGGTTPYSGTGIFTTTVGLHTYTVTDNNGCTSQTSQTLVEPTVLTLSESYPAIAVEGGTTTITLTSGGGTGALTYKLNNGAYASGNVFTGQVAGTYTAFVKDANGCITQKSFTVTQPTAALAALAANTVAILCNGGATGTAVVTASGGTAPYTYSKNGVTFQGSATFTGLAAGAYTFTVKDAVLATSTTGLTITQPNPLVASATFTAIACYGESSTLTISASGGIAPYMGTDVFLVLAGAYSKTVTDANGCTVNVNGTIPQPIAALTISANNYGVVTVTGGTTSDTIVASGGTGAKTYSIDGSSYQSSAVFTDLLVGDHTASVKDANNCLTTSNFTIPLSLVTATISAGTINCFNGTTTITVSAFGGLPPYSGTGTFTVGAGTYSYVVTDANGATSSVGTTVANPTQILLSVAATNITQVGGTGSAVVTASGGTPSYTYSLNGASFITNNTFTGLAAGNYSVAVKDSKGCISTTSFTISSNIPPSTTITTRRSGMNVYADFNTTVAGVANMKIVNSSNNLVKNQNVNVPVGTSTFSMSIKSLIRNHFYTFTVTLLNKTSILSFNR